MSSQVKSKEKVTRATFLKTTQVYCYLFAAWSFIFLVRTVTYKSFTHNLVELDYCGYFSVPVFCLFVFKCSTISQTYGKGYPKK